MDLQVNSEPDPSASNLVHLTRLHSIKKSIQEEPFKSDKTNTLNSNDNLGNININLNESCVNSNLIESNNLFKYNEDNLEKYNETQFQSSSSCNSYQNQAPVRVTYRNRAKNFLFQDEQIQEKIYLDDQNWSFKSLKKEFKCNNFDKLFYKYKVRIQHNFFTALLTINLTFNVFALYLYYYYDMPHSVHIGVAITRIVCLLTNLLMLILIFENEYYLHQSSSRISFSLFSLLLMMVCEYAPAIYGMLHSPSALLLQRVRPIYYFLLANHVFLPHARQQHAFICTLIVVLVESVLTVYSRLQSECLSTSLVRYMLADFIFYATCSIVGYFINLMLEVANRRAFLVYRFYVESKFHLEHQLNQQDKLLNACIPEHLTARVKIDLTNALFQNLPTSKPFNELYIEKYTEVTILYADIVNSMLLSVKLSPQQLVLTLNELFQRFDEATENNKCLRIKITGDCYYLVCGMPNKQPNHAWYAVSTGLCMIDIIKDVRAKYNLDVDMRIGIHTGMVLSGIMGLYKWQYDIWSLDSMRASEMERTGVSGMLHLTKSTMKCLNYKQKNKLLIKERYNTDDRDKITYLVQKKNQEKTFNLPAKKKKVKKYENYNSENSYYFLSSTIHQQRFLVESVLKYREMINYMNKILENAINEMPLSKKDQWFNSIGIQPVFLLFRKSLTKSFKMNWFEMESRFRSQPDPLYIYYLICVTIICFAMIIIKLLVLNLKFPPKIIQYMTASSFFILISLIYVKYKQFELNLLARCFIWFVVSGLMACFATFDLITPDCIQNTNNDELTNCAYVWYYTYSMVLAISSVCIFIRVNCFLKLILYIIYSGLFYKQIYDPCSMIELVDKNLKWNFYGHIPQVGHVYYFTVVTFLLHIIDRQIEYILRLDFQWAQKLDHERKEAIHLRKINRLLVMNLLPEHVASRYMQNKINLNSLENVYTETYKSVAVMFASIVNYEEIYTENKMNNQGLKCLQILNEIIHDFDKLILFNEYFYEIEKIKTSGSTYMAVSGLYTKRDSVNKTLNNVDEAAIRETNVVNIIEFGIEMMKVLQKFNKDAFQEFKLRIGIAEGPVIASVIGATKPQYDIWGDIVNVASRMDSFGCKGRIHMTKEVAQVLMNRGGYFLECRGEINVKGKGKMVTFLLQTIFDDDDDLHTT